MNLTAFSDNCEYSFRQLSQKLIKESLSKCSFKAVSQESLINESISYSFNCNISSFSMLTVNGFLTHILLASIGGKFSFKLDVNPKRCSLIAAEIASEVLDSAHFSCNSVKAQKDLKFPF
jgi:hypothetical protein